MNEVEAIDKMLQDDADSNSVNGFISPPRLFDKIGVPPDLRGYLLQAVIGLGVFEYNTPQTGIRATYLGRKIYKEGGYKKYKRRKKLTGWVRYIERLINIVKP